MMPLKIKTLRLWITYLLLSITTPLLASEDEIRILIPAFDGPDNLGFSVSTFINFQVFRTLRKAPTPNPKQLSFGEGKIVWSDSTLSRQSHKVAEEIAMEIRMLAQLVFWGKVWPYGDSLLVQAYLTMPYYKDHRQERLEVWDEKLSYGRRSFHFAVDIPRRRLRFPPIYLRKDFVKAFSSPHAIPIYRNPNKEVEIGRVGKDIEAIEVMDEEWVKVVSNGNEGWIQLPLYAEEQLAIMPFIGGLIRIYRGDWKGAYILLDKVVNAKGSSITLRVDALLLQARSLIEQGKDGMAKIETAFELDPYSDIVVTYYLMAGVSNLGRLISSSQIEKAAGEVLKLKALMARKGYLFSDDDPFTSELQNMLRFVEVHLK